MPRASRAKGKQLAALGPPTGYHDATSPEPVEQDELAPQVDERSSAHAVVRILPVHRRLHIPLVFFFPAIRDSSRTVSPTISIFLKSPFFGTNFGALESPCLAFLALTK